MPSREAMLQNPELYTNMTPGGQDLNRFLSRLDPRFVRPEDFKAHMDHFDIWVPKSPGKEFTRLHVEALRPKDFDPTSALRFLHRHHHGFKHNAVLYDQIGRRGTSGSAVLYEFLLRTAKALAKAGKEKDAHWVVDFGRAHLPDRFYAQYVPNFRERLHRDSLNPNELHFRRYPTAEEIARGRPVDKEGFVMPLTSDDPRIRLAGFKQSLSDVDET